jgi:transcriptional regulator with XRE-family HTH domain
MAPSQALTSNFPTTTKDLRRRFEEMASEHVKRMGARIKDRREELGLTQRQLADLVGGATDGNQVSKWERGANRPTDARLEKIADALQVEPAYFHTPPPVNGTGDLMTAMNPERGQLDRIENKLDAILAHLGLAATPTEVAGVFEAAAQQPAVSRTRSAAAPRTRRS